MRFVRIAAPQSETLLLVAGILSIRCSSNRFAGDTTKGAFLRPSSIRLLKTFAYSCLTLGSTALPAASQADAGQEVLTVKFEHVGIFGLERLTGNEKALCAATELNLWLPLKERQRLIRATRLQHRPFDAVIRENASGVVIRVKGTRLQFPGGGGNRVVLFSHDVAADIEGKPFCRNGRLVRSM